MGNGYDQVEDVMGVAQPMRFNSKPQILICSRPQQRTALTAFRPNQTEKCPGGWHHYEKTASCYKVYLRSEDYWQAVETCRKVNGSLATFVTNEELQFILKIEVDFDDKVCDRRDQCKLV